MNNGTVPALKDCVWEQVTYYPNGKVHKETDSDGGRTDYEYDADGQKTAEHRYDTASTFDKTTFSYNNRGLQSAQSLYVKNRHLNGQPLVFNHIG